MVKQFEEGKIYILKGRKKPYEEIIEAAVYKSKNNAGLIEENLMLDSYHFDEVDETTKARIYETGGSLEDAMNCNPKDYKEIGTVGVEYVLSNTCLTEAKPSYKQLEIALNKIAKAKPSDFRNWHRMADYMQDIAKKALRLN